MNASELLEYVFEDAPGEITVLSDGADESLSLTDISEIGAALERFPSPTIDLITTADVCVGVVSYELPHDKATFFMVRGDHEVPVFLFANPIPPADLDEADISEFPAPVNGWEFRLGTDIYYTSEELEDAAEVDLAPADASGEDGDPAGASPDGGVGGASADQESTAADAGRPLHEDPADTSTPDDSYAGDAGEAGKEGPAEEADSESSDGPPSYLNDADLLGADHPEMDAVLEREVTFMTGELWGPRDRRNTQDGDWKAVKMPLSAWIVGGENPVWGFSRHPVGKHKEGASIVLGESIDGARTAKSMKTMYALGLDIDSGAQLDDVIARIEELSLFALVYTSFNHGKQGLQLKRDEVLRKLGIKTDPTLAQVKEYLHQHDKHRYEPEFIAAVEIKTQKKQVKEGVVIELDTPPLDKFRLIFPLATPVELIDLAETQAGALEVWEDTITGLAVNTLGVHFDTACTDPSRLFYTPRHPKAAEDWCAAIIRGKPLALDDVKPYKKSSYTKRRDQLNPFELAGDEDGERAPQCFMPSGKSLNEWHSRIGKDRFLIANVIEDYCQDKQRHAGGEKEGTVHTECPFEHEHSQEGGTATMAVNCLDNENGYWTWFCRHDSCQNRHKLQFLEEALRAGWFDEDVLTDEAYVLPAEDEEAPEEAPDAAYEGDAYKSPEDRAAEMSADASEEDVRAFLKTLFREGVDLMARGRVNDVLVKNTPLSKTELKSIWKGMDREQANKEKQREQGDVETFSGIPTVNDWDFHDLCTYGHRRMMDKNAEDPHVFHYMDRLVVIREDSKHQARIKFLDRDGFSHELNTVAKFARTVGDGNAQIGVSAPTDVVSFLYSADYSTYPDIRGLVTSPTFSRSGHLITEPGYDVDSQLYYHPNLTLSIPRVSAKPAWEEVEEAKRLLIEECLADFPLGAKTRPEIVEEALHGDGIPAVTNMIGLILLPFMREMVDGPTPGHLLTKPAPGTGASLLTDVFSIIATGQVTPAMSMPTNKDEMSKTLTSVLANGQNVVFFDNISENVDSGELASAMTAPTYQARILGKTQTVETEVRCAWVLTGNNVQLSSELVRRLVMVDLDARVANPERRTGFRHKDIRGWVTENRGELVWACLTLIQYWIANGMKPEKEVVLASYENWSSVVGGILKACGLEGFMANRDELQSKADDAGDDDMLLLIQTWWDEYISEEVPVRGGDDSSRSLIDLALKHNISVPARMISDADGNKTYESKSFGKFLAKYRDRVYPLEDGTEVRVTQGKRTRRGSMWQLVSTTEAPKSNVDVS